MSKKKHNLVIVAHPDDETLFFAGLILASRKLPWHVACVTDGNADGQGAQRAEQFQNACKKLGVKKISFLNLPDDYSKRLDGPALKGQLAKLDRPNEVYTHGPLGEYGHPHHQDVSLYIHEYYDKQSVPVWSVAHNCPPDKVIKLTPGQYRKKCEILSQIYFSETRRFLRFVPATYCEGFAKVRVKEIQLIHKFLSGDGTLPSPKDLKKYLWIHPYLGDIREQSTRRTF